MCNFSMAFCDAHDGEWLLLPDMTDCWKLLRVELKCGHFRFPTDLSKKECLKFLTELGRDNHIRNCVGSSSWHTQILHLRGCHRH